jgi:hypothetical protein
MALPGGLGGLTGGGISAGAGKVGKFFKGLLTGPQAPHPLTAQDLYSGPAGFGDYRPETASAGRESEANTTQALGTLGEIANTGWSTADRAAQGQAQRQSARNESSQRGAVMQNAAARGQLNGGNTFLAGLSAQQGGANRNMEAATDLSIAGAQRRQGAAMGQAQLGQQLTENEFQRAGATDQFNQWATGMQSAATQGAYDSRLAAYQAKQANRQKWIDRITGLASAGISRPGGG